MTEVVCRVCHFLFSVMGERDANKAFVCEGCGERK